MSGIPNASAVLFLFIFFVPDVNAQSATTVQKKSQVISIGRLKNAMIVEELIDQFPSELEIVSCRISIAGKGIKYSEHVLPDHTLPDLFSNIHAGHKIFVEYIRVKKKGSVSKAIAAYDPIELVVTENSSK